MRFGLPALTRRVETVRPHEPQRLRQPERRPEPGRGNRLRPVPALRSLRALHVELSDVHRSGRRERRPPRPHPTDADGGRRPQRADRPHAPAPGIVPGLPRVRDGLPLGRPLRPADRAVPAGGRAGRPAAGEEIRLVPRDHPLPTLPLRGTDAQAVAADPADAADRAVRPGRADGPA